MAVGARYCRCRLVWMAPQRVKRRHRGLPGAGLIRPACNTCSHQTGAKSCGYPLTETGETVWCAPLACWRCCPAGSGCGELVPRWRWLVSWASRASRCAT